MEERATFAVKPSGQTNVRFFFSDKISMTVIVGSESGPNFSATAKYLRVVPGAIAIAVTPKAPSLVGRNLESKKV
jgi:hypothetical protein